MAKLAFYTYGILEEKISHPKNTEFLNRALGIYESISTQKGLLTALGPKHLRMNLSRGETQERAHDSPMRT